MAAGSTGQGGLDEPGQCRICSGAAAHDMGEYTPAYAFPAQFLFCIFKGVLACKGFPG